jgi:hypothetical protein
MPRNSTGKWVQRAASTGGGRTYRGQRPVNWYASLVVICVLGLLSIVWARYQHDHPASASAKSQPTVGTTWNAAMGGSICGTQQPPLAASPSTTSAPMTTDGQGVLVVAPKTSSQAGDNAVFSQFISNYKDLTLTSSSLGWPKQKVWHNGDTCPKGTPDAGKKGTVQVAYWASFNNAAKDYTLVSDPGTLKPANGSEITMNFVPEGSTIKRPPIGAIEAMVKAYAAQTPSTTTTAPTSGVTTPTTAPTLGTTTTPSTTATTTPTTTATTQKK